MTPATNRRLHAVAAQLGLDHAALRDACGVASLAALDDAAALKHLRRLEREAGSIPRSPAPPLPRLVNVPAEPASDWHRATIFAKFCELRWDRPRATGWLKKRHGLPWMYGCALTRVQARQILSELDAALAKGPGGCTVAPTRGGT